MNAYLQDLNGQPIVPENIEAEQQLLGAILINNDALAAIKVPLEPKHFYEPIHGRLFEAMQEIRSKGDKITPISLKGYFSPAQRIGELTMFDYMSRLFSEACSVLLANQHAADIIRASVARDALAIMDVVRDQASNHWGELSFADEISALTEKLRSRVEELNIKDVARPGASYIERFEQSSKNAGAVGVSIGIKELRKVLNENVFEAGNLYGLLSSSGEGKTSLTLQIILHALKQNHPVLFLSYDQSQAQCVSQMIAQTHGIEMRQQKDPDNLMSESEREKSIIFATWLDQQPIEIIRCRREGNKRLLAYASNFVAKHKGKKTPLIVIDHIKKITSTDQRMSPDKIASEINVEWKSFADETHSAVLMLNQRNGEMNKRINPRPIGKDLYGGEGAKEDYDAMIYLYRPAKYRKDMLQTTSDDRDVAKINRVFAEFGTDIDNVAELGTIKCRFGDTSQTALLEFEARYTRYRSKPGSEQPQGRLM